MPIETKKYDNLCCSIKHKLNDHNLESGYRHYCVLLKPGKNKWEGKAGLWI